MNPLPETESDTLRRRVAELEIQLASARDALLRKESELQLIMDHVPALLCYVDRNQVYRHVNQTYLEWTGRPPAEIIGRTIGDIIGEPHISNARPWIARALKGERVSYESQLRHRDGTLHDIAVTYTPDVQSDGRVEGLVTLVQDITDRKRTEQRLRELNRELERRVAEFATLFELTPVAIGYALDSECRDVRANPALGELLGLDPTSNPSKTGPNAGILPYRVIRDGEEVSPDRLPMQTTARMGVPVRNWESTVIRGDGSVVDMVGNADPLFDETGQSRGCVAVFLDVTESNRTQKELGQLTQKLQAHLSNSPLAVVEYTPDFRLLRWNREAERLFGWSPAELIGRRYDEFPWVHEDDAAAVTDAARCMFAGEQQTCFSPNRNYTKDGRVVHMEWYNSALFDGDGRITSVLSFGLDVTARNEAERALRLNEERFRTALQHAPLTVFNQDLELRYTWIQNCAFGMSADNIIGRTDFDVFETRDDAARVTSIKRRAIESCTGVREEVQVAHDGVSRWFDLTVEPLRDESGTVTGVTCAAFETTSRRRMEDAVRESEERWRLVTQALPVLVWTAGADGYSDYSNDRWLQYTGQTLEETVGYGWLSVVHPDDIPAMTPVWQQALASGEDYEIQYRIRRGSDGEYRWHLVRAWPLKDGRGRIMKWIGTSTDVHDYRRLAEELRRSNDELLRANQDLEQFAWAAAHDLQEPLRTLSIYNQLLARRYSGQLDEEADRYISFCVDAAHRMQLLVTDLLGYTRVSGRSDRPTEAVRCDDVLSEVVAGMSTTLLDTGATLDRGTLPVVSAHRAQVAQLFQNLLSNAIKYRRPGVPPHIRIYAAVENGPFHRFYIEDNGIGIDPQYSDRVFGLFKRLHGRDVPGTGIGLAICRRIVETYGGAIGVISEGQGKGTTFTFTLPAA